jgi:hypothetical protein
MLEYLHIDDYPVGIAVISLCVTVILICQIIITKFLGKEALRKWLIPLTQGSLDIVFEQSDRRREIAR